MQEKKSILNYENLPETITPYDYADWRGIGENKGIESVFKVLGKFVYD